ncbi:MAG: molecular chaperone TorD family protein, partial [Pseudomonadota bacterium]
GGELTPYASFYLTGFLHEKPLARLRADLREIGVQRSEGVSEPEDHIAMLLETMAGLIVGDYGDPASLEDQKRFFEKHIQTWAPKFFADLEAAPSASLYMPIGALGRLFMAIETEGFGMA